MTRIGFVCFFCVLSVGIAFSADNVPAKLIAGRQVEPAAIVQVGQKLVAYYDKKAYLVEIKKINTDRTLKIVWIESAEESDEVKREELYYMGDSTPTRKSKSDLLPEAYRAYDKNKDGQIGLYEWDRSKLAEFRLLDKNRDGFLTPQELGKKPGTTTPATTNGTTTATTNPATNPAKPTTAEDDSKPKVAPANMLEFNERAGDTFAFTLTGKSDGGAVWGDGTYSTDSNLAAAAVHSGVLKNGASATVSITILAAADKFAGKTANGVTSLERNESGPAFTLRVVP